MSLKHQIQEEETLIAYFKQMLMDVDDEQNYQSDKEESLDNQNMQELQSSADDNISNEVQMQVQPAFEVEEIKSEPLPYAPTKSLETLLESVDSHTQTQTQIQEETALAQVQEQVVETVSEVKTQIVEPEAQVETKTQIAEPEAQVQTQEKTQTSVAIENQIVATTTVDKSTQTQSEAENKANTDTWQNIKTEEEFQTLFFTVQGVRFAVPLIDLGNILECGKITEIFGKPAWYMGMTDNRGEKINIVDTLLWVKPEIGESPEKYPYLISLSDSNWALGCDILEGNKTLNRSEVKWRVNAGSRPWLAGIVKDQMCALLHVEALIKLFEKGLDHGQIAQKLGNLS